MDEDVVLVLPLGVAKNRESMFRKDRFEERWVRIGCVRPNILPRLIRISVVMHDDIQAHVRVAPGLDAQLGCRKSLFLLSISALFLPAISMGVEPQTAPLLCAYDYFLVQSTLRTMSSALQS